jgi:hypothetical protein
MTVSVLVAMLVIVGMHVIVSTKTRAAGGRNFA